MGIINILDKQTANLIAAGEVVERPSSAIKEMLENSADAGATQITVEIKNGGNSYIRITDNGIGMTKDDVPKCILRHATSKIKNQTDLEYISTFGFRGEALAAISSVSTMRILTRRKDDVAGTIFECRFGEQTLFEETGCPEGTTITVENIFENVPARRKFLKKDSTEALSVGAVCEKFALSRPDISVTFISDNTTKMQTPGDSNLKSAIYAALGRDFSSNILPVDYELSGIRVHGFIGKPEFSRPNRNLQNFFVNNRYIRSRTMMAAIEEGFRGFCPTGKFPACVLFCDIDFSLVDVNVHPAKLEIKFSDERRIFDTVYFAVKNTLTSSVTFSGLGNDVISEIRQVEEKITEYPQSISPKPKIQENLYRETPVLPDVISKDNSNPLPSISFQKVSKEENQRIINSAKENQSFVFDNPVKEKKVFEVQPSVIKETITTQEHSTPNIEYIETKKQEEIIPAEKAQKPKYIGEVFDTYIIAQYKSSMYIVDKHAAHERIIYEKLKNSSSDAQSQYLLEPITVTLTPKEAEAAIDNKDYFSKIGFEFDEFDSSTLLVRAIPSVFKESDTKDILTLLSGKLSEGNTKSSREIFDKALFSAACRAAIKGGDKHTDLDNSYILNEIFTNDAVLYCPHGRPVISEFSRQKLEKIFDRL